MNKTPDPDEVARDKVVPAVEELIAAMAERLGPLANQAVGAVTPFAHQTTDRVGPLAQQAAVLVAPYVALLREQGTKTSHDLADRLEPAFEAAYESARDALSGARDRVTAEVIPGIGAIAATAAASASPLVTAATDRGRALIGSTRSEPVVEPVVVELPTKKRSWFRTLAVVAAAAGATYVVVRKLVGDKGSQWQTARPTTPYASGVSAEAGVATATPEAHGPGQGETEVVASTTSLYGTVGSSATGAAFDDSDESAIAARSETLDEVAAVDDGDDSSPGAGQTSDTWGEGSATEPGSPFSDEHIEAELATAEERVHEEPEAAVWAEEDAKMGGGPEAHPERYDIAGAYVGVEPPAGYTIKGNERSMKYHLPDSNSFGRTIAQVWFASEEAAQQAGFTRAQH